MPNKKHIEQTNKLATDSSCWRHFFICFKWKSATRARAQGTNKICRKHDQAPKKHTGREHFYGMKCSGKNYDLTFKMVMNFEWKPHFTCIAFTRMFSHFKLFLLFFISIRDLFWVCRIFFIICFRFFCIPGGSWTFGFFFEYVCERNDNDQNVVTYMQRIFKFCLCNQSEEEERNGNSKLSFSFQM